MAQKDFERLLTLPEELRLLPRWVLWGYEARDGRPTKVPCAPADGRASSTDAVMWTTFEKALEALEPGSHAGLGCMIGDPYVGIDLARTMVGTWVRMRLLTLSPCPRACLLPSLLTAR